MGGMFAHITPLETPIIWFAFLAGAALGGAGTWFVLRKRTTQRP